MDYRKLLRFKKKYRLLKMRMKLATLFIVFITIFAVNISHNIKYEGEFKEYSLKNNTRFLFPAEGIITAIDKDGSHEGSKAVDIANQEGTPIYSAMDGKVIFSGIKDGYGNCIIISHKDNYSTLYGHLEGNYVEEGELIKLGQHIADMGKTGDSTGSHLHFEIRRDGERVKILDYFSFLEEDLKVTY